MKGFKKKLIKTTIKVKIIIRINKNLMIEDLSFFSSKSLTINKGMINIGALIIKFNELIDANRDKSFGR
tara:strand:- start:350 stop:556 length:207 start_codon:yes stop_codon:yes gene_type:complete